MRLPNLPVQNTPLAPGPGMALPVRRRKLPGRGEVAFAAFDGLGAHAEKPGDGTHCTPSDFVSLRRRVGPPFARGRFVSIGIFAENSNLGSDPGTAGMETVGRWNSPCNRTR